MMCVLSTLQIVKIWILLIIFLQHISRLLLACVIFSFISVSCNTPTTFENVQELNYVTLIVDFLTGFILTIEATVKICSCVKVNVNCW